MTDSCASCFFYFNQGCHVRAPDLGGWPSVQPTDWCGYGADSNTGVAFSHAVNSLAGPTGPQGPAGTGVRGAGSFTSTNGSRNTVVNDASTGANVNIFPANAAAALFVQAHGVYLNTTSVGVSFTITSADGTNFTGAENFDYQLF